MSTATVNITAAEVNRLRQQTGAGMMDCKKALTEANGDFEKAIDILREKGQKVAANRSDRDAKEGVVIAKVSTGFIYAISRTGVTGARQDMTGDAKTLVKRLRRFTKLPIAVGFGISTPEQFAAVGKFAEAGVVGSAIVHAIEQNPGREAATVAEFVQQLSAVGSQLSVKK